jgi:C4-type Zn-finger protein
MKQAITGFGATLEEAGLSCPSCGSAFKFHHENISLFYESGSLVCEQGCGEICLLQ